MKTSERLKKIFEESGKSYVELEKITGISKSSLQRYANDITDKIPVDVINVIAEKLNISHLFLMGWEDGPEHKSRTKVHFEIEDNHIYINVPLYSYISCGTASFVEDNIEDYISLPESLLKVNKDYFCQYAKGDSMIGENILEGDLVVFEKVNTLDNGKIGCFCVDHNEATCKKFYHDKNSGIITLQASNPKYEPIIVTVDTMNFRVLGQLALVINKR